MFVISVYQEKCVNQDRVKAEKIIDLMVNLFNFSPDVPLFLGPEFPFGLLHTLKLSVQFSHFAGTVIL
jgi:hypothetical protein